MGRPNNWRVIYGALLIGIDPIVYMYNHLVDGDELARDRIKCKASVVDSDNINTRISSKNIDKIVLMKQGNN